MYANRNENKSIMPLQRRGCHNILHFTHLGAFYVNVFSLFSLEAERPHPGRDVSSKVLVPVGQGDLSGLGIPSTGREGSWEE